MVRPGGRSEQEDLRPYSLHRNGEGAPSGKGEQGGPPKRIGTDACILQTGRGCGHLPESSSFGSKDATRVPLRIRLEKLGKDAAEKTRVPTWQTQHLCLGHPTIVVRHGPRISNSFFSRVPWLPFSVRGSVEMQSQRGICRLYQCSSCCRLAICSTVLAVGDLPEYTKLRPHSRERRTTQYSIAPQKKVTGCHMLSRRYSPCETQQYL